MKTEQGSTLRQETLHELETLLAVKETLMRGRHQDILRSGGSPALRQALVQVNADAHQQVRELWQVLEEADHMARDSSDAQRAREEDGQREVLESYVEFLEESADILEKASNEFPPSQAQDVLADLARRDRRSVTLLRRLLD